MKMSKCLMKFVKFGKTNTYAYQDELNFYWKLRDKRDKCCLNLHQLILNQENC